MNIVNINKSAKRPTETITDQAYYWAAKLDGEPNDAVVGEFQAWLTQDPDHRKEFKRVAAMWDGLDSYLSTLLAQVGDTSASGEQTSTPSLFAKPAGMGLALCALAAITFVLSQVLWQSEYNMVHTTAVGEIKQVDLPDGSGLKLNTNTQTEVSYEDNARLVHLVSGEAHFEVAHQPDKPFVVYAGDVAVKAVGTAFSVHITDDHDVEVIVSEGTVELSSIEATSTNPLPKLKELEKRPVFGRFNKGQKALLAETVKAVEEKSEQELTKELSWRNGMLIFDNRPLNEVVKEISRYTEIKIVVLDDSIRDMAIGGYFPAGKTEILLSTLEQSFGIQSHKVNPSLVHLSRKAAAEGL